jgi:CheY-like chemotaxis protein
MTTVLVADDSPVNLLVCSHILQEADYKVLTAEDGLEAWLSLQQNKVDLLVSDIAMPEVNGFTLLRRIRANHQLSKLPVILLTGIGEPEAQLAFMAGTANRIMSKPVSSWELANTVTTLLEQQ